MAKGVDEVLNCLRQMQKNLECSICLELLRNPHSTKCNHQYCWDCINQVLEKSSKKSKNKWFCPLCKTPVTRRSLTPNPKLANIVAAVKNLQDAVTCDIETPGKICLLHFLSGASDCHKKLLSSKTHVFIEPQDDHHPAVPAQIISNTNIRSSFPRTPDVSKQTTTKRQQLHQRSKRKATKRTRKSTTLSSRPANANQPIAADLLEAINSISCREAGASPRDTQGCSRDTGTFQERECSLTYGVQNNFQKAEDSESATESISLLYQLESHATKNSGKGVTKGSPLEAPRDQKALNNYSSPCHKAVTPDMKVINLGSPHNVYDDDLDLSERVKLRRRNSAVTWTEKSPLTNTPSSRSKKNVNLSNETRRAKKSRRSDNSDSFLLFSRNSDDDKIDIKNSNIEQANLKEQETCSELPISKETSKCMTQPSLSDSLTATTSNSASPSLLVKSSPLHKHTQKTLESEENCGPCLSHLDAIPPSYSSPELSHTLMINPLAHTTINSMVKPKSKLDRANEPYPKAVNNRVGDFSSPSTEYSICSENKPSDLLDPEGEKVFTPVSPAGTQDWNTLAHNIMPTPTTPCLFAESTEERESNKSSTTSEKPENSENKVRPGTNDLMTSGNESSSLQKKNEPPKRYEDNIVHSESLNTQQSSDPQSMSLLHDIEEVELYDKESLPKLAPLDEASLNRTTVHCSAEDSVIPCCKVDDTKRKQSEEKKCSSPEQFESIGDIIPPTPPVIAKKHPQLKAKCAESCHQRVHPVTNTCDIDECKNEPFGENELVKTYNDTNSGSCKNSGDEMQNSRQRSSSNKGSLELDSNGLESTETQMKHFMNKEIMPDEVCQTKEPDLKRRRIEPVILDSDAGESDDDMLMKSVFLSKDEPAEKRQDERENGICATTMGNHSRRSCSKGQKDPSDHSADNTPAYLMNRQQRSEECDFQYAVEKEEKYKHDKVITTETFHGKKHEGVKESICRQEGNGNIQSTDKVRPTGDESGQVCLEKTGDEPRKSDLRNLAEIEKETQAHRHKEHGLLEDRDQTRQDQERSLQGTEDETIQEQEHNLRGTEDKTMQGQEHNLRETEDKTMQDQEHNLRGTEDKIMHGQEHNLKGTQDKTIQSQKHNLRGTENKTMQGQEHNLRGTVDKTIQFQEHNLRGTVDKTIQFQEHNLRGTEDKTIQFQEHNLPYTGLSGTVDETVDEMEDLESVSQYSQESEHLDADVPMATQDIADRKERVKTVEQEMAELRALLDRVEQEKQQVEDLESTQSQPEHMDIGSDEEDEQTSLSLTPPPPLAQHKVTHTADLPSPLKSVSRFIRDATFNELDIDSADALRTTHCTPTSGEKPSREAASFGSHYNNRAKPKEHNAKNTARSLKDYFKQVKLDSVEGCADAKDTRRLESITSALALTAENSDTTGKPIPDLSTKKKNSKLAEKRDGNPSSKMDLTIDPTDDETPRVRPRKRYPQVCLQNTPEITCPKDTGSDDEVIVSENTPPSSVSRHRSRSRSRLEIVSKKSPAVNVLCSSRIESPSQQSIPEESLKRSYVSNNPKSPLMESSKLPIKLIHDKSSPLVNSNSQNFVKQPPAIPSGKTVDVDVKEKSSLSRKDFENCNNVTGKDRQPRAVSFVTTRLNRDLMGQTRKLAQMYGGRVASEFNKKTTHVIMATDERFRISKTSYTMKYLMGLALGKWIVSHHWVTACIKAKALLPEDQYEVKGDHELGQSHIPRVARQARRKQRPLLLCNYNALCLDEFHGSVSKAQLYQLLHFCGANICSSTEELTGYQDQHPDVRSVLIIDKEDCQSLEAITGLARVLNIPAVTVEWVTDSIANFSAQDFEVYHVGSDVENAGWQL
ncbi:predicted protein [Nematostella vectensis]|uniref:RING-type E3 ubiquitin transferase BRCA1 n=1 Tax=Nematostella vectensis TaxID=45351 RepID=A7RG95_NEMVE|nr:predicted protein [Nematostella vectensis]|eukprot:XP_001641447.1 predicted protein [Nematostella vectensis]